MAAAYLLSLPQGQPFRLLAHAVGVLAFQGFGVEVAAPGTSYRIRETDAQHARPGAIRESLQDLVSAFALSLSKDPDEIDDIHRRRQMIAEARTEIEKALREFAEPAADMTPQGRENKRRALRILESISPEAKRPAGSLLNEAKGGIPAGLQFGPDAVTDRAIVRSSAPRTCYRRTSEIAGLTGFYWLIRAIDLGLTVSIQDAQSLRYIVTGPTANQVRFLAQMQRGTDAAAMAALGITAQDVAEEDRPDVPEIKVSLPTRTTTSDIKHDNEGRIVHVTQTETSEG